MMFAPGLALLKAFVPSDRLYEYDVLSARLSENLRRERLYGGTETLRYERATIMDGLNQLSREFANISFNDLCVSPSTEDKCDIVILTILPEEYAAVHKRLITPKSVAGRTPQLVNLFAWVKGQVVAGTQGAHEVVLGQIGKATNVQSALATWVTVQRFSPRYVLLVGIAGGFERDDLSKGDVVFSDTIVGYEYGKLDVEFSPRHDFTFRSDIALLTAAEALSGTWCPDTSAIVPAPVGRPPKALPGMIASGDKVVDNRSIAFFKNVMDAWPRIHAVEMEGVGAAAALALSNAMGVSVGFLMIRGISDMPRAGGTAGREREGQTAERDGWKEFASEVAADFAVQLITKAWPVAPSPRSVAT